MNRRKRHKVPHDWRQSLETLYGPRPPSGQQPIMNLIGACPLGHGLQAIPKLMRYICSWLARFAGDLTRLVDRSRRMYQLSCLCFWQVRCRFGKEDGQESSPPLNPASTLLFRHGGSNLSVRILTRIVCKENLDSVVHLRSGGVVW